MNRLLQKDKPYQWTYVQQKAFDELKDRLTAAPILAYPNFRKIFILATDASYLYMLAKSRLTIVWDLSVIPNPKSQILA